MILSAVSKASLIAGILAISALLVPARSHAASATWNGGSATDGNWTDGSNWVGGAAPGDTSGGTISPDVATFNIAIAHTWGISAANPVVIDSASENIGGITFTTGAAPYFIGSTGGNALLLSANGTIQVTGLTSSIGTVTETVNAPLVIEGTSVGYTFLNNSTSGAGNGTGILNFGGAISGTGAGNTALTLDGTNTNANTISGSISNGSATTLAITKNGTGTWSLAGTNTFTGGTTLNNGSLGIASDAAINSGVGGINFLGGALQFNNYASSGLPASAFQNVATLRLGAATGAASSLSTAISGSSNLTFIGPGTLNLTVAETYSGTTAVTGGTLGLTVSGQINNTSMLTVSGGTLDFGTSNQTVSLVQQTGGTMTGTTGTLTSTNNFDLQAGTANVSLTGAVGVVKSTNGLSVLGGANTYSGPTTVNAGTLQFAKEVALYNNNHTNWTETNLVVNSGTTGAFNIGGTGEFTPADVQTLTGLTTGIGGFLSGSLVGLDPTNAPGASFSYGQSIANPNGGSSTLGLAKLGTGSLLLTAANTYTGVTNVVGGPLTVSAGGAIGSIGTPAGTLTVGLAGTGGGNTIGGANVAGGSTALLTVSGGSVVVTTLNSNNEGANSGVRLTSGSITVTGNLGVTNDGNNNPGLVSITGGTLTANSVTVNRTNQTAITGVNTTGGSTTLGLYVNGGTLNVTTTLGIGVGNGSAQASTPNMRIDSGTVNVGGATTVSCNNGGRYGILDANGGTFTSTDTTTGIQIGGSVAASEGELLIRGSSVVTTNKILFGSATQTSGNDQLEVIGGTLYVGAGGIATNGFTGTTTTGIAIGLASGTGAPTLGAIGDWSSTMVMSLANNSTGVAPTIKAADSSNVAHNITLSGRLSGGGGLNKTGGGTLTLDASNFNSYTGVTTISGGVLSTGAAGRIANFASTSSIGQPASAAAANLVLDGGTLQNASTGAAASTDRLFTLTQNGGTLDASGTNPLTFANAGAIAFTGTGARTLTLTGSNTGANTLTPILGDGTGATSLAKSGAGSWTVSGANTFSGSVTVNQGNLTLGGSNSYGGATTINGGRLILPATGSLTGNTAITANNGGTFAANPGSATTTIGSTAASLTLAAGSSFTMQDTGIGIININSIGGGSGTVLTLAGTGASPANLSFDVGNSGSGADQLIANNGTVSLTGNTNYINLDTLGSTAPGSLTNIPLISVPNGTLSLSNFALSPTQAPLVFGSTAYAPTLALGAGNHSLVLNLAVTSLNFYWKGGNGASWGTANNFATDQTGATLRPGAPTLGSNVFLTANTASNSAQTLNGSFSINSLSSGSSIIDESWPSQSIFKGVDRCAFSAKRGVFPKLHSL